MEQPEGWWTGVTALVLDGTYNVRAVPDAAGRPWLYRSAALDSLTEAGTAQLARHGLSLVLDLREDTERLEVRHGVPVRHVPLYCSADGPPDTGSLTGVYRLLVTRCGRQLARAVGVVADATGPVLVHCAAGKDRTGLVVAVALRAAGVAVADVLADYALSAPEVTPHRTAVVTERLARLGLTESEHRDAMELHLQSPPEALERALHEVDERGDVHRYLLDNGLRDEQLARLLARGRHE